MIFKNLEIEMIRKGITRRDIADLLKVSYNTVGCKVSGKNKFLFDEAVKIRDAFFPSLELDYLFSTKAEDDFDQKGA